MANDFKPFATGPGANVTPQNEWEGLPALLGGFQAGKASSAQINKALRQASFIAAALAQYTADKSGEDVLDDGDVAGFIAKMADAFGEDFQPKDANLAALAGLAGAANRLPYFTGANALALTALTAVGRDLIGKATVAEVLTYLGLGDVVRDTRTINGKRLNADIALTAAELGIGQATEAVPGIVQISDAINANDSKVAASSAAVYKLLPKRVYAANDFIRIPDTPGGLMLQWGRLPSGEGVNFPTPFTNNCLWCVVIPQSAASGPFDMAYLYTRSFDRFGFLRSAATTGTPCYWLAIGY